MTDRLTAVLHSPRQGHEVFVSVWQTVKEALGAGKRLTLEVKPETRSDLQNRRMWAMLTDISQQVDWHGIRLSPEDWKAIFTAAMKKARIVPGLDGGFVVLAQSSSRMSRTEMSEMQEMMAAFGAERGVTFKEKA
jgi:hypothetical protein